MVQEIRSVGEISVTVEEQDGRLIFTGTREVKSHFPEYTLPKVVARQSVCVSATELRDAYLLKTSDSKDGRPSFEIYNSSDRAKLDEFVKGRINAVFKARFPFYSPSP